MYVEIAPLFEYTTSSFVVLMHRHLTDITVHLSSLCTTVTFISHNRQLQQTVCTPPVWTLVSPSLQQPSRQSACLTIQLVQLAQCLCLRQPI